MTTTVTEPPGTTEELHEVLRGGVRTKRPSALSASLTHGWRAMLKIKHVPEQLLDVTLFPIMMTVMFTYIFGGALDGSVGAYLQFFIPGILVQTVVMITMYTGSGLNTDIQKGIFDRFRSLPAWRPSALVGSLLGDVVRYFGASTIIVLVGLVMGYRPEGGLLGVLIGFVLLLVFSFSLSWIWTTLGLLLRSEKSVTGVSMLVLFPLTFVSNIFVRPETMPEVLQAIVAVNPITLVVDAVRGAMGGTLTAGQVGWVLIASALLVAIFAPLSMRLYRTRK
ncbi:ABC-2 type transport system permease protein [Tamaricihabitans halophyticus]|uniref:Transport permease protein n=1 Tax=Tamaricihabitans halophyticus TaxID=1262583 RepID=A0A4R2R5K9_9PSEU|nr:ABC transporter permease [Tamaricihabitans halophyticus]TCP57048.1 ABC-2 type transport system permease protein [Tamaricihabitans halophyticus]